MTVCGHWQPPTELPQVKVLWQSRENAEWLVKHRQTVFTGVLGRLFGVNMVNGVVLNCLEWYSNILDIQAFVQTNKTYYRFYCKLGGSEQTWVDCEIKHDPKWANMHKIFPIYRLDTMLVFLDQQQLCFFYYVRHILVFFVVVLHDTNQANFVYIVSISVAI